MVSSLEVTLSPWALGYGGWSSRGWPLLTAIAFILPPALLWAYDDTFWQERGQPLVLPSMVSRPFRPLARSLAIVFLSGLLYLLSFHWGWQSRSNVGPPGEALGQLWMLGLQVAVLLGLALLEWIYLVRQAKSPAGLQEQHSTTFAIAGFLVVTALAAFLPLSWESRSAIATLLFNVLLFLLAAGLMREGIALGQRGTFWLGMSLLTLQILSRLFEYNTNLLFKSLVLFLCGLGIIVVGLWFERYVHTLNPPRLSSTRLRPSEEDSL